MKLGAQLYSVRDHLKTPEDVKATFLTMKEIGYENVQLSGNAPIDAEVLKGICEETGTDIVITHIDPARVMNETDEVIREHKIFGCPVIGLGSMPKEYRNGAEGVEKFLADFAPAAAKIEAAGLKIAYHNHAFELTTAYDESRNVFDYMIEACPNWQFTADVYWLAYGNCDPAAYLRKIGGDRLINVHFKDMSKLEDRSICACGDGVIDFAALTEVCSELGVKNILVEQDNANKFEDGDIAQMRRSFAHLRPIIPKE